jgi:hypothetical protein
MSHLLLYYQRPEPATWVFLSSFLLLSIYFVFHRFFSIRNLDIVLLLLLAPGLMMVYEGRRMLLSPEGPVASVGLAASTALPPAHNPLSPLASSPLDSKAGTSSGGAVGSLWAAPTPGGYFVSTLPQSANAEGAISAAELRSGYPVESSASRISAESLEFYGFIWLLAACFLLLIRMLVDPALVRRPLLTPNLSIGGLSFIGVSLFLFLMANVITSTPLEQRERGPDLGPGYALLNMLPELPTTPGLGEGVQPAVGEADQRWLPNVARIVAIVSNLAIVFGIVGVGYWHFDNVKTGIGCAVMYLLLPYTAQMTGNLQHILPAALLVLALLAYRQPLIAGVLLGLAAGLVYYPLFLLPLWISFYWFRGLKRLISGVSASLLLLSCLLLLQGTEAFLDHLRWMYGLWLPRMEGLVGVWGPGRFQPDYRLPILVAFILLASSFVFWPPRKNLGTLICGTAAVMLASQFWHGNGGGLFMAWFLPFVMLTIFRPNLDDRIAVQVVRGERSAPSVSTQQREAAA